MANRVAVGLGIGRPQHEHEELRLIFALFIGLAGFGVNVGCPGFRIEAQSAGSVDAEIGSLLNKAELCAILSRLLKPFSELPVLSGPRVDRVFVDSRPFASNLDHRAHGQVFEERFVLGLVVRHGSLQGEIDSALVDQSELDAGRKVTRRRHVSEEGVYLWRKRHGLKNPTWVHAK